MSNLQRNQTCYETSSRNFCSYHTSPLKNSRYKLSLKTSPFQNFCIYSRASLFQLGLLILDERPKFDMSSPSNIIITWSKPKTDTGLHETVRYDVECYSCEKSVCNRPYFGAKYDPRKHNLTRTSVVVSNLKPGFKYVFRVYPKNSVNEQVVKEKWNFTAMEYFAVKTIGKMMFACYSGLLLFSVANSAAF